MGSVVTARAYIQLIDFASGCNPENENERDSYQASRGRIRLTGIDFRLQLEEELLFVSPPLSETSQEAAERRAAEDELARRLSVAYDDDAATRDVFG